MLLRELEELERAWEARGYRVRFAPADGAAVELTRDDGSGWATSEDAEAVAARLRRVSGGRYREVRVVGPEGVDEAPLPGDETPAAAPIPQPQNPPADAFPVAMGLPLGPVTVLALPAEGGPPSERALVGDGGGQVYCCYRGELEGREGVRWRAKQTTFESVNITPDRTLDFHDLYWPASGGGEPAALAARVAFWGGEGDNGSGLWWVLRGSA